MAFSDVTAAGVGCLIFNEGKTFAAVVTIHNSGSTVDTIGADKSFPQRTLANSNDDTVMKGGLPTALRFVRKAGKPSPHLATGLQTRPRTSCARSIESKIL